MGDIVPFVRRREERDEKRRRVTGFAITLQTSETGVMVIADDVELDMTPAQARSLAADLTELADDAEAG